MKSMSEVMLFKQQVRDLRRSAADNGDERELLAQLSRIELSTSSQCELIHAFHNGNGALIDLAVDEAAFDRHGAEELGQAICATMQAGESIVREAHASAQPVMSTGKANP